MVYSKHLPKVLGEEDLNKIIETISKSSTYLKNNYGDYLKHRDSVAILLCFWSGLRPAECLELKWSDVDFEKRLIYVRPYVNHKRKNDLPAVLTKPAEEILRKYKEVMGGIGINSEFLFPSIWTLKPITSHAFGKRFRLILQEAGLNQVEYYNASGYPKYSCSMYDLRHSYCSHVYKATHSEIAVARLARHTRVASADIYVHLNTEEKIKLADYVFNQEIIVTTKE